jgi:hypothetical protein
MSSRRKSAGSKGWRSGRPKVKPVNYSEGENDEDKSDVSENDTNEEESVKSKGNYTCNQRYFARIFSILEVLYFI